MSAASPTAALHAVADRADLTEVLDAFSRVRFQTVRVTAELARELGVAPSDLRALIYLADHDSVTPKQVAHHLSVTTGALTGILDRVERVGYVHRAAHPSDRRSLLIELTPAGRDAVEETRAVYASAFAAAIAPEHVDLVVAIFDSLAAELGRR